MILFSEKASEYEQEMPQSQTNPRHNEEETQNTDSHTTATTQLNKAICPFFLSKMIAKQEKTLSLELQ